MGLFDLVKVEYPLPGNPPEYAKTADYQTRDFDCRMRRYKITEDGQLLDEDGKAFNHITATVDLVWNNVAAVGPGIYTHNGEDARYLGYRVTFVDGKVRRIEETGNRTERAAPLSLLDRATSPEEQERRRTRASELLLGRTLVVCYGANLDVAYEVTVIVENETQLVVRKADGRFEILNRTARDHTFFDSLEDATVQKTRRTQEWERQRQEYENAIRQ